MRRIIAITGLVAVAVVGLTACSAGSPEPAANEAVTVVTQPTPAPSLTLGRDSEVVVVTPESQREAITAADAGTVIEMGLDQILPITGLPNDNITNAPYVTATRDDIVQVQQRRINMENGVEYPPTVDGLAPGISEVTVYDNDPTGNKQKRLFSFTVHVQDVDGAALTAGLSGVVLQIAAGDMRVGDAVNAASDAGFTVRIVSNDGQQFPVTKDVNDQRLNFTVENGIVTAVTVG